MLLLTLNFTTLGICTKKFEETKDLKSHLEMHKDNKQCQICYETFTNWPALLGHRLEHIPEKQGKCHICDRRSKSSIYMEYHYLSKHNNGEVILKLFLEKIIQKFWSIWKDTNVYSNELYFFEFDCAVTFKYVCFSASKCTLNLFWIFWLFLSGSSVDMQSL